MASFDTLPTTGKDVLEWTWQQYEPYARDLLDRDLTGDSMAAWLADWTALHNLFAEAYARLYVDSTIHTQDEAVQARLHTFLDTIYPQAMTLDNALTHRLLESGIEPPGFAVPLRNMRAETDLFREANLPLLAEHQKLGMVYNKIIAGQTVEWEGREVTVTELANLALNADRPTRERAWRLGSSRILQDREAINENWRRLMDVRAQIARNADKPDFRAYLWQDKLRFDYTPDDCRTFHAAIEQVVVPAAARVYERRRRAMGVDTLRPWDLSVNPLRATDTGVEPVAGRAPLKPFSDAAELEERGAIIFDRVDPQLGVYFNILRRARHLDLSNHKGKAPGAYCITYPVVRMPFIFMNAVGTHEDVQTLLHESGHAFHSFEIMAMPYHQMRSAPMEFNEVASMAMELLAAPYLTRDQGGFYTGAEAARARIDHLEGLLIFWPYMAVVDAFQHWVYENHAEASDPARCDAKWAELWGRFMVGVDYSGLEDDLMTGWHRKLHIHRVPLYYVEYGLAQLGAVQVWANALEDQAGAVAAYRRALALGGTVTLPELYAAAGARFAFDADTLSAAVELIERTIDELSGVL